MAFDPVEIYLENPDGSGWSKSIGWTDMRLARSKDQLTGALEVTYFFSYVPQEPVMVDVARGREILVYIDGWLAFTGLIDKRQGQGSNSDMGGDGARSVSVGPDQYSVTLTARGKTKALIDSSHDVAFNMNGSNTQEVLQRLVEPWGIELDWRAQPQVMDKVRFRDGARVVDEIARTALENSHFIYEDRLGRLRVTDSDATGAAIGDNLILGQNILTFRAEQSENKAVSRLRVKGQRTGNATWGEDAVLPTVVEVQTDDLLDTSLRPLVVQHYGDASPEALQRRAMYEANKRSQRSKNVTVDVFSVDSFSGVPWDLGNLHRVVIPPEGVDDVLECTGVQYYCNASGELKTTLTLAPPPTSLATAAASAVPLGNLLGEGNDIDNPVLGSPISFAGSYPAPWSGTTWTIARIPVLGDLIGLLNRVTSSIFSPLASLTGEDGKPPERLN